MAFTERTLIRVQRGPADVSESFDELYGIALPLRPSALEQTADAGRIWTQCLPG
jgi:hypothetical protein